MRHAIWSFYRLVVLASTILVLSATNASMPRTANLCGYLESGPAYIMWVILKYKPVNDLLIDRWLIVRLKEFTEASRPPTRPLGLKIPLDHLFNPLTQLHSRRHGLESNSVTINQREEPSAWF